MAATDVKVKQEKLQGDEHDSVAAAAEEQAKQLAAAQTAAALAGVLPVAAGLTADQMQQVLASRAALGNLGQLGNLQYLTGVLAANSAAAVVTQAEAARGVQGQSPVVSSSGSATPAAPSPFIVVPQFPAQYMTCLPQLAAAQTSDRSPETAQPPATAAVTPTASSYDSGVLDLSKGPTSKSLSPNTPDSGIANIPYDARERTKTEKLGEADIKEELDASGKKGMKIQVDIRLIVIARSCICSLQTL